MDLSRACRSRSLFSSLIDSRRARSASISSRAETKDRVWSRSPPPTGSTWRASSWRYDLIRRSTCRRWWGGASLTTWEGHRYMSMTPLPSHRGQAMSFPWHVPHPISKTGRSEGRSHPHLSRSCSCWGSRHREQSGNLFPTKLAVSCPQIRATAARITPPRPT